MRGERAHAGHREGVDRDGRVRAVAVARIERLEGGGVSVEAGILHPAAPSAFREALDAATKCQACDGQGFWEWEPDETGPATREPCTECNGTGFHPARERLESVHRDEVARHRKALEQVARLTKYAQDRERERDEARADRDAYAANLRDAQADNAANAEQVSRLSEEVERLTRAFEERGIRLDAEIASREATLRTVVSERTKAEARARAAEAREAEARAGRESLAAALRAVRTLAYEWQTCDAIEGEDGEITQGLAVAKTLRHCAEGVMDAIHPVRAALSPRPSPGAPTKENA